MPFEISTTREFCAAHQLRLYDGSIEPLHGHNWQVKVTVSAGRLDGIGVVMDFHVLERLVDSVIGLMHNGHLNALPAFVTMNPSAENVAAYIGGAVSAAGALPAGVGLVSVEVWETAANSAVFRP